MKRASYRDAIDWVAQNDSAGDDEALNPEVVGELITAVMVAHLWDVPYAKVGADIVRRRRALDAKSAT